MSGISLLDKWVPWNQTQISPSVSLWWRILTQVHSFGGFLTWVISWVLPPVNWLFWFRRSAWRLSSSADFILKAHGRYSINVLTNSPVSFLGLVNWLRSVFSLRFLRAVSGYSFALWLGTVSPERGVTPPDHLGQPIELAFPWVHVSQWAWLSIGY